MQLPFLRLPERAREMPWNTGLLICNLTLTTFLCLMVIIVLTEVAPIVPDIVRVLKIVDSTLGDVGVMMPDMNATIWDLHHLLPGVEKTIYFTEAICKHTAGCV